MSMKSCKICVSGSTRNLRYFQNGIVSFRKFCLNLNELPNENSKYTADILPEVEKALENGKIKHRKHPGVWKVPPIVLPEKLINAVRKLITEKNEKSLKLEAKDLCHYLTSRRLPIEMDEINRRIKKMCPSFDGNFEILQDDLSKRQIHHLKKEIRCELGRWKPIQYDYHQCLVYLVGRLAPNYASACKVFQEIKRKLPSFKPKTFFDFGSGVGSALWAAHSEWCDSIQEFFCVDAASAMNEISQALLTDENTEEMLIKRIYFRQFLPASEMTKYDLVVSAFSLLDVPSSTDRLKIIDTLWRKTNDILVIIETGNNAGFLSVLDARDYILMVENTQSDEFAYYSSGAHVIAPCPHDFACPRLSESSLKPCGFHVQYETIFPERHSSSEKKDWISYVVLRKGHRAEGEESLPRIVKPVLKKPRHISCQLCCNDGKLHDIVITKSKHGRHLYRCARIGTVGDIFPAKIKPLPEDLDQQFTT